MMNSLLKEVGRGKRGSRDLTYDEAFRAAEFILNGVATPAQIGAFLIAQRLKMESTEELIAFLDVCRGESYIHPIEGGLDCAAPYDGRSRSFYAALPTAFILTACGIPVTLHSSPTLPPKNGVTLYEMLQQLQIKVDSLNKHTLIHAAEKSGFLFVPTEKWCPPLARIRDLRTELELRTLFNTVEKLLRFSDAPNMTIGIFHGTVVDKIAKLVRQSGVQQSLVIQGMEGSDDISVERRTRAYWVSEEKKEWIVIDPELLELQATYPEMNWTVEQQCDTFLSVLKGNSPLPFYHTVLLNAGVRIWLCGKSGSIEQGIYEAKYILDNGHALDSFNQWKETVLTSMKV
ncbi:anthranilate phosphoribosyltransferase [Evansella sp. AB-rgal1]|uniref:anthranilate phosphoribosyltransferase n=1 Tax=Evansella sp. AB-rgal1 TaxID=3242696 RepID=UPI00359EFB66